MIETVATLRRKISSAEDLQSVVRTMKAMAAAGVGQYEQSVRALADYYRIVELGLSACFRENMKDGTKALDASEASDANELNIIVFGSDQGLVGKFNDVVADFAINAIGGLTGKPRVWAVGERVHAHLADANFPMIGLFSVPNSVQAIAPLVGQIQLELETQRTPGAGARMTVQVFHNRPEDGGLYQPVQQRLLPLDAAWQQNLSEIPWPTKKLPEVMFDVGTTLRVLIREYLFISLFRSCAESLASENASRLAAMERADTNIDELLENFRGTFNRMRQSAIDEELFDVISGYESGTAGRDGRKSRRRNNAAAAGQVFGPDGLSALSD